MKNLYETEPENLLYVGKLPDPAIELSERNLNGYTNADLIPLLKERALELFDQEHIIYNLYTDGTESMVFEREEIIMHEGIFGIETAEWIASKEYASMVNMDTDEAFKESTLIFGNDDTYGIYMLKQDSDLCYHRFASINQLKQDGLSIERSNYKLVHTASLGINETLSSIYASFDMYPYPDIHNERCISVSDVIVLQRSGIVTSHYVDDNGFKELPSFLGNEHSTNHEMLDISGKLENSIDKSLMKSDAEKKLPEISDNPKNRKSKANEKGKPSILSQLVKNIIAVSNDKETLKNSSKHDTDKEV